MKNLAKYQLDTKKASQVKGGLRFVTRDAGEYINKRVDLMMEGKSHTASQHNGEYCIEW